MNELMIFENKEFGDVRWIMIDGVLWFMGVDIARALEYEDPRGAVGNHVQKEDIIIIKKRDFQSMQKKYFERWQSSQNNHFEQDIPNRGVQEFRIDKKSEWVVSLYALKCGGFRS